MLHPSIGKAPAPPPPPEYPFDRQAYSRKLREHLRFPARIGVLEVSVDERRVYASRADAVATDLVADEVHRDGSGHRQHRTLAHRVCKTIDQSDQRSYRSKIENRAATGPSHPRHRRPRAKKQSLDVDRIDAIEIPFAVLSTVPICAMPALLTRMSRRGASRSIRSNAVRTEPAKATSQSIAVDIPPFARMSPAVSSPAPVSRSRTNTRAPALAKVLAIARPIPDPAPVTAAIFPSSRNIATSEL